MERALVDNEVDSLIQFLSRVDSDLSSSSGKLVSFHVLLMHLLAWNNDLEAMVMSATSIEKALEFDLLSGILDSEVREVENFVEDVQAGVVDARGKVASLSESKEVAGIIEEKLSGCEELLKKCQGQLSEVNVQSVKLQKTFSPFKLENWNDTVMELATNGRLSYLRGNTKRQTTEQQRHVIRLLEKSLSREIELEKKLSQVKQSEEQLKLKLHYTEQVALRMEEAAEVVWGRFLEAENVAEVLMGTSKELVGRLQIVQLSSNVSYQREEDLKSKLQSCAQQLYDKDITIAKLERLVKEHEIKSLEVPILLEKIKSLEEQVKKSESRLINANALNEESQEQLSEMENLVESLKESLYEAESRAEAAENKITQINETNIELNEEINFLKGNRDSDTRKVSLLEKQVRDLEIQLQHAKASSEASQEQTNMLYTAIWDMETLIEDLKSKVSKAENKTETVEEQCVESSEKNEELVTEVSLLRSRVKALETSLEEADKSKAETATEINTRTKLLMDSLVQLAREREVVQIQMVNLTKQNKYLMDKLEITKRQDPTPATTVNNENGDSNEVLEEIKPPFNSLEAGG